MTKQSMEKNIKKMSGLLLNNSPKNDESFQNIELNKIIAQPQPRKIFDENSLDELAASISLYGVMTPITVSKNPDKQGTFILRQGERRYRASLKAGKKTIPAVIDDDYQNAMVQKQLIENLQRENLTSQEIADSILYLIDEQGLKKGEVAKALSKSNAFVSNYYALATFDHKLKDTILSKTQDVILIADFKRLLKNASDEECSMINDFLIEGKTFSRTDMEELKKSLKEKDDIQDIQQTAPTPVEHDPFAKNIDEPFDREETAGDDQPHMDEITGNIKDDDFEETSSSEKKKNIADTPKKKQSSNDHAIPDEVTVSLSKIFIIIENMVADTAQAAAIINQIKDEVFNNAN